MNLSARRPNEEENVHIRIGTSGWRYPEKDVGWQVVFYPRGADDLEFYSHHFDTVEVNSTFYRPATAKMAKRWVERTPPGFRFSVKLWQKFTHPNMFEEATGEAALPAGEDFRLFKEGLDPLAEAGKLGLLLLQFPPGFHATERSLESLERHLVQFREYPLAVELRHRSWSDREEEVREVFSSLNVAWVYIDEPKFPSSIRQELMAAGDTLYVRFHGRNRAKWWTHDQVWERYDYLYGDQELLPFAEAFQRLVREGLVRRVYAYFNNHARAQAVANALMLKDQMGLPLGASLPEPLCRAFPALEPLRARTAPAAPPDPTPPETGQMRLL